MNSATTLGLDAVNKARQASVVATATSLIGMIVGNQKSIANYSKNITAEQEMLKALALDVVTQKSAMGTEFTGTLNENQKTILEAIKAHNDAKQGAVSLQSQRHINNIKANEANIALLENQIGDWRKQLSELSVDVVTPASVVGAQG